MTQQFIASISGASPFHPATERSAQSLRTATSSADRLATHGDTKTCDRLIREIAVGATVAVVFISNVRSPLDATRIAIAGDGTDGTIAAAVALMAREQRSPKLGLQVLICPITNADLETPSYRRSADGPG